MAGCMSKPAWPLRLVDLPSIDNSWLQPTAPRVATLSRVAVTMCCKTLTRTAHVAPGGNLKPSEGPGAAQAQERKGLLAAVPCNQQ